MEIENTRRVRLIAAGTFLLGFACFVPGLVLMLAVSHDVGSAVASIGAAFMAVSRLMARRLRLPAP